MKRRTVLKIVALGALSTQADTINGLGGSDRTAVAWSPADYKLRFFTDKENELLDQLMELIIPADGHSPGARAAQVSLFADLMVSTSSDPVKAEWRKGLQLIGEEASKSSVSAALSNAAAQEAHPTTDLHRFFAALKTMTVNGYYTSAIGIHQDLQYAGNTYLSAFPGCPIPNLES